MKRVQRLLFGLAVAMIWFSVSANDMPDIDPNAVVAKYGKPDRIQSTEYDKPRPPQVTRMLEYRKESVRFMLVADAPIGSPPPYKTWKLMGLQDMRYNSVISQAEADKRLAYRVKK